MQMAQVVAEQVLLEMALTHQQQLAVMSLFLGH
jgi:hypothetical protein